MIERLCLAASEGDIETAKYLIENQKVDVNAYCPNMPEQSEQPKESPPIAYAVKAGQVEMVKRLVEDFNADIFYCERDKNKKHLFLLAINSDKGEEILDYLAEKGLKFDLNLCYTQFSNVTLFHEILGSKHVDALISILKNKLTTMKIELFYLPMDCGRKSSSIIAWLFEDKKPIFQTITVYLITCFILRSNAENFQELRKELSDFKTKVENCQSYYKMHIGHALDQTISLFAQLHDDIKKSVEHKIFLSQSQNSKLGLFPAELWHKIFGEIASFYLPNVHEKDRKKLVEMFDRFNLPFWKEEIEKRSKFDGFYKIAMLSYREWRFNHYNLFCQKKPKTNVIRDNYEFLKECLIMKFQNTDLSFELRKKIIEKISNLDLEKFNGPHVLEAIEEAKASYSSPKMN